MKEMTVSAKVPAKDGNPEVIATITVPYAETLEEAKAQYSEEAVLSNAFANWRVVLQGNIRNALKRGETPEAIQARLKDAKMGVATTGGKIDPVAAYIAKFQSSTPEDQAAMLADLKKKKK